MKQLLFYVTTFLLSASSVSATSRSEECQGDIACLFPPAEVFSSPSSIINTLLPNIILIAGIILFILVIVVGFQMVTSAGDPAAMEKWRTILMYGVVGFLLVLFAYTIVQLVEYFTDINILNPEESFSPQ